jgi:hypothetical protein
LCFHSEIYTATLLAGVKKSPDLSRRILEKSGVHFGVSDGVRTRGLQDHNLAL